MVFHKKRDVEEDYSPFRSVKQETKHSKSFPVEEANDAVNTVTFTHKRAIFIPDDEDYRPGRALRRKISNASNKDETGEHVMEVDVRSRSPEYRPKHLI